MSGTKSKVHNIPKELIDLKRWMISCKPGVSRGKAPVTIHKSKPDGYAEKLWLRSKWGDPAQYATGRDAIEACLAETYDAYLCFVLREDPDECDELKSRFIVFDVDPKGQEISEGVREFLDGLGTYVERSKSGEGFHAVGRYFGPEYKNQKLCIDGVDVDVLISSHFVMTGDRVNDLGVNLVDLAEAVPEFEQRRKYKLKDRVTGELVADAFDSRFDLLPDDKAYLAKDMQTWDTCVSGAGGDTTFYKAACHLARHGVTGEAARELLAAVPLDPPNIPFTHAETTHKIESAFLSVSTEGEFGAYRHGAILPEDDFEFIEEITETEAATVEPDRGRFPGLTLWQHLSTFNPDNMPAYILDRILFEEGALIIGGQNKTFKTSIGVDLLLSIASGRDFLNSIPVLCKPKSIAVFSSETRDFLMSQYLTTVLKSKKLTPLDLPKPFTINSAVPVFSVVKDRINIDRAFKKYLTTHKPEIVFVDPLYQVFRGVNQADISSMGQALESLDNLCRENGAMLIICHHSRKPSNQAGTDFPTMTLNDLSGAGGGAFARQWLLLSHAEPYAEGVARLNASIGASGGDTQDFVVSLNTWGGTEEAPFRIWKPSASKADLEKRILRILTLDPDLTPTKLKTQLGSTLRQVQNVLDDLYNRDLVEHDPKNRYRLISQTQPEQDF